MMTNMFSIFDPATDTSLSLNWLVLILPFLLSSLCYWLTPSPYQCLFLSLCLFLFKEFKLLTKEKYLPNLIIFINLLTTIMMINLFGLMPYIFTPTSHMSINLPLSLTLWISFMLYGWIINTNHMFTHLTPMNTPNILMPFMVIIESISNIIRPWTLTIRLTANMLAGHLLLSLLGSSMTKFMILIPLLMMIQNMLIILEVSVALIQSYVFSILSTLYFNETNKDHS